MVLKRLGIAEKPDNARQDIAAWPDGNMNPNRVYLLVVTFYEVRHGEGSDETISFKYMKDGPHRGVR